MPNPNPPNVPLTPGVPQYLAVNVVKNDVQPDGTNPGLPDPATALTFEQIGGLGTAVQATDDGLTADGRRVIKMVQLGTSVVTWQFRVRAPSRTATFVVTGTTAAPLDVSGAFWDNVAASTTRPT